MVSVTPKLSARFVEVLTNRTLYPRFSRMTFVVTAQTWSEEWEQWCIISEADKRKAVTERWKTAFGAFADASDIELEVVVQVWQIW